MTDTSITFAPERKDGLLTFLAALRRHAKLLVILVVGAVAAALLLSATATKRYEASADILIQPLSPGDETYQGFSLFRQTYDGAETVVTAARLINSHDLRSRIFDRLGADADGASVSVRPLGQANIITVQAAAPDPDQAARVANAYVTGTVQARSTQFEAELSQRITRLQEQIAAIPPSQRAGNFEYSALQQQLAEFRGLVGTPDPTISRLTTANAPSAPVWPRPLLSIAVALVVALLLGVGIAMLLEVVNPRIASEDELVEEHRLPILARIPRLPKKLAAEYLVGRTALPRGSRKAYSILRAVLATLGPEGGYPRSILVASASPGDGKTTTAVNLSLTLASSNLRVILVDGDLHRPMVASAFGVSPERGGVAAVLTGRAVPEQCLVPAPNQAGLRLLLSNRHDSLGVLFDRARLERLLEQLGALCDVVVIDSPPLAEVAETLDMANVADCVLLAVRLGRTRRDRLFRSRELLARRGVTPLGFVVTTQEGLTKDDDYAYGTYPAPQFEDPAERQDAAAAAGQRRRRSVVRLPDR